MRSFVFGLSCLLCFACASGQRDGNEVPKPESYPPGALEPTSAEEKAAIAELGPVHGCEGRFPIAADGVPKASTEAKPRDSAQTAATIGSHRAEFVACYKPRLRFNPYLAGDVDINFTILPSGHVTDVYILRTTIPDCFVPSCLAGAVQRMTFATSEGVHKVTMPLRFVVK